MKICIINGPNLNLQGIRQPEIYGTISFKEYLLELKSNFPEAELAYFQSNHVGELIDKLHEIGFSYDGIILNAAAYTHTSVALGDAVAAISTPVIEVHISNIYSREVYRQHSFISKHAKAVICGFGLESYSLAMQGLIKLINPQPQP
ncbi:type II 3-dehydroquinate dehydratase [Bacteroidota bacterium]